MGTAASKPGPLVHLVNLNALRRGFVCFNRLRSFTVEVPAHLSIQLARLSARFGRLEVSSGH